MRRLKEDVIMRDIAAWINEAERGEEFFDREMWKMHNTCSHRHPVVVIAVVVDIDIIIVVGVVMLTMVIKLEQDNRSACSWSSHRQSGFSLGIPSEPSRSTARTSASSSTRSGRVAATRHCNKRRELSLFGFLISRSTRSYVSSNDSGNAPSVRRRLDGKQCCRVSSWQNTQRNLLDKLNKYWGVSCLLTCHLPSQRASRSHLPYLLSSICSWLVPNKQST